MIKSIYVSDDKVWSEIETEAVRLDRSVSWYLIDCHRQVMKVLNTEKRKPEYRTNMPTTEPDLDIEEVSEDSGTDSEIPNSSGEPAKEDAEATPEASGGDETPSADVTQRDDADRVAEMRERIEAAKRPVPGKKGGK